ARPPPASCHHCWADRPANCPSPAETGAGSILHWTRRPDCGPLRPTASWCLLPARRCRAAVSCRVLHIIIEQGALRGLGCLTRLPCVVDGDRTRCRVADGLIRAVAVQPFQ